jgi:uncharacterized protein YjaG (DUF416 family)
MMTLEEFLPRLERELERLSPSHRLVFSASCCQRALPNLNVYARQTRSIDLATVRQVLEEVWEFTEGTRPVLHVVQLREACEDQLPPNPDDHILAGVASDTIQMVGLVLQQASDPQARLSKEIADWGLSVVDGYLQIGPKSIEDLQMRSSHPLMQRELGRQELDLDWLKSQRALNRENIEKLRSRAISDGGSLNFTPWVVP